MILVINYPGVGDHCVSHSWKLLDARERSLGLRQRDRRPSFPIPGANGTFHATQGEPGEHVDEHHTN
jgi:hypothetical protein